MTINHNRAEVYKAKEKGVERGRQKKRKRFYREIKKHAKSVQKDGLKTKYQRKGLR